MSNPRYLYEGTAALSAHLRVDALVTCASCREGHAGLCMVDELDAQKCPVDWLHAEIGRRETELPN